MCTQLCSWLSECKLKCKTLQNIRVFLLQQGRAKAAEVRLFSLSIFSRVCAISFVSRLPGSKSLEHNGPCLGPDNSHFEWKWERREWWGETEGSYRKLSLQQTVLFFSFRCFNTLKSLLFSVYLPIERARGVFRLLLLPQQVYKWQLSLIIMKEKKMLKVDYLSSADECGIALPMKGREAAPERPA